MIVGEFVLCGYSYWNTNHGTGSGGTEYYIEVEYRVVEKTVPEGYTSETQTLDDGTYQITNYYTPTISVTGGKTWSDYENKDETRPEEITVKLLQNGEVVKDDNGEDKTQTISESENGEWTYTFENLAKYDEDGNAYTYTVKEEEVTGYKTEYQEIYETSTDENGTETQIITGYNIINTYTATTEISGAITWEDYENGDGTRPEKMIIKLYKNDEYLSEVEVTPDENGEWKFEFKDLEKYDENGEEYKYTINTDDLNFYVSSDDGQYHIHEKYVATVNIPVSKIWIDYNNADGTRPNSITVNLLQNGKALTSEEGNKITATLSEENNWEYTFEDLDKYDENNEKYDYSVTEDTVANYDTEITGNATDGFTITNTYTTSTKVSVEKSWNDYDNVDNTRPDSIKVNLLKNGQSIDTQVITAEDSWKYTFEDLEKYDEDGNKYTYSVTEDTIDNYNTAITGNQEEGFIITNTYTSTFDISGTKIWIDNDNGKNTRPASITINLLQDGTKIDEKIIAESDNWNYMFTDLEKYDESGNEYVYTIEENEVEEYITTYDENYNVINTLIEEEEPNDIPDPENPNDNQAPTQEEPSNTNNNKVDNTTAPDTLPQTGQKILPFILLVGAIILTIVLYIKFRTYDDIK